MFVYNFLFTKIIFVYKDLFSENRRNPNQCPIKSTFYVSHEWTDYSQVQDLYAGLFTLFCLFTILFCLLYLFVYFYAAGHEIASHTVTHSDGKGFDDLKWADEVIGLAEMLVCIFCLFIFLSQLFVVYICKQIFVYRSVMLVLILKISKA